jgi:hypothetical protein
LKSGSLNLLEPSGPVQTFNGISFAFFAYAEEFIVWASAVVWRHSCTGGRNVGSLSLTSRDIMTATENEVNQLREILCKLL